MFITKKHLSRRTVLRGIGVSMALPFLDSMVPAQTPIAKTAAASRTRFAGVMVPHGNSGSCPIGMEVGYWFPRTEGAKFEITQIMRPLEPFREYLNVFSGFHALCANPQSPEELGADHARSASTFLTGAHVKRTEGSDVLAGTSLDQYYAKLYGQDTPLPSIELCIEDQGSLVGSCGHGYSCVYANTTTWSSPTTPLPMDRDPRVAFERLFGDGGTAVERAARTRTNRSILDAITKEMASLQKGLDPSDKQRLTEYLDDVRELERRIQKIEARNTSGDARALPDAPIGVPDSFDDHVKLMFDLQWLAFSTETTRVATFMMGHDNSPRVYPESGFRSPFHGASHHGENAERIAGFAKINEYHVKMLAYFLDKLHKTPDGDGNLLDHSLVLYGSPMGNANVHAHNNIPLALVGKAGGKVKGNNHVAVPDPTTHANLLLAVADRLGVRLDKLGNSTGQVSI